MKNWKPIMIENSPIPGWLSVLAPISIGAIALGFVVISKDEMDETTRRHETIHFQQYLETLFIGFLIIYLLNWIWNLMRYGNGAVAYRMLLAEREAYQHEDDEDYLANRKRWKWLRPT